MSFHLLLHRNTFTETTTTGTLRVNGDLFCFTLEDRKQPKGVKVDGETCIPEGTYYVDVTMSSRFKRLMPMIYNQANGYELIKDGISFKGIRLHGGNTHLNSHGCVLVARKRINSNLIQGTMEAELTKKLVELGGKGFITVISNI